MDRERWQQLQDLFIAAKAMQDEPRERLLAARRPY
jgi:hypothetical protein